MSLSRQVLSSPFDVPQRKRPPDVPIKVLTSYNGCKVRNRQHLNNINIMVDTRVVRRSIFHTPNAQNSGITGFDPSRPFVQIDRRLLDGCNSVFANPIVIVTGGGNENATAERKKKDAPSPVQGRQHVCIQTDEESIDECFGAKTISSSNSFANELKA
jgi:hypothetical protein